MCILGCEFKHKSLISGAWRSHTLLQQHLWLHVHINGTFLLGTEKGQKEDAALSLFTLHDNECNLISDPADQQLMPAKQDLFNEIETLIAKIEKKKLNCQTCWERLLWLTELLQQIHYFSLWVFFSLFLCWFLIPLSPVVTRRRPSDVEIDHHTWPRPNWTEPLQRGRGVLGESNCQWHQ